MSGFEIGIQLHLPTFGTASVPNIVAFGRAAHAGGVGQIWMTDNLCSRNPYVVLTALAASIPIKLGTAVTVQYFRSPVDVADSVAAITELMGGREFSLGLGRGNRTTPRYVSVIRPISMLRETAQSLAQLLNGESVCFADYPNVARYFNLQPTASFRLPFASQSPVRLYCGANGPRGLAVGGAHMDGIIFGGTFQAVTQMGHMERLLRIVEHAAADAGRVALPKVAEIKLSVARDGYAAREFVRHSVARRIVALREEGYTDDDYRKLAIEPADIDRLVESERRGGDFDPALVTDAMIDALFVSGSPAACREKMVQIAAMAERHGYGQLMFSELGPDVHEGLRLLCDEVLPSL